MRAHWSLRRHKVVGAVVASVCVVGSAVVALSVSLSAQTAPSGADLASEYLAALKPAGAAISIAEAKLEKLPVTVSVAQVKTIVAPLGPALSKLGSLSTGTTNPAPASAGQSLESLGAPSVTNGGTYSSPASGAHIVVGGRLYSTGFQLNNSSPPSGTVSYTWRISKKYSSFTAQVALDDSGGCTAGTVRFLGDNYESLPIINAKGKVIERMGLGRGGFDPVKVDISQQSSLAIQVLLYCGHTIVDFTNDHLA